MDVNDRKYVLVNSKRNKKFGDPPNIAFLLGCRQVNGNGKIHQEIKKFAEMKATVSKIKETRCDLPTSSRSTFLISFSHDCTKVASTHGDHNIYISDVNTGKHLRKLEGHPRTPWCVAFHPTSNDVLASGCLAGQVRVWDLHGGSENWKADDDHVIASLSFHPFLKLLVIASGSYLYFWDWSQPKPSAFVSTNSEIERVRYVKFDSLGQKLITGISNMNTPSIFNSNVLPPCHSNDSQTVTLSSTPVQSAVEGNNRSTDNPSEWSYVTGGSYESWSTPTSGTFVSRSASPCSTVNVISSSSEDENEDENLLSDGNILKDSLSLPAYLPPASHVSHEHCSTFDSVSNTSYNEQYVVISDSELAVEDSVDNGKDAQIISSSNSQSNSVSPKEAVTINSETNQGTKSSDSPDNDQFLVLSNLERPKNILPHVLSTSTSTAPKPVVEQFNLNPDEKENEPQSEYFVCDEIINIFKRLESVWSDFEIDFRNKELNAQRSNSTQEEESYTLCEPLIEMFENFRLTLSITSFSLSTLHDKIDHIYKGINDFKEKMKNWNENMYIMLFDDVIEKLENELERLIQAKERLSINLSSSEVVAAAQHSSKSSLTLQTAESCSTSSSILFTSDILPSWKPIAPHVTLHNDQHSDNIGIYNTDISKGSSIRVSSEETSLTKICSDTSDGNFTTGDMSETIASTTQIISDAIERDCTEIIPSTIEEVSFPEAELDPSTINNTESIPSTSAMESNSRNTNSHLRMSRDHFPSLRFNPLATSRRFRRNMHSQLSLSAHEPNTRSHSQQDLISPSVSTLAVNENISHSDISALSAREYNFTGGEVIAISDESLENDIQLESLSSESDEANTSPVLIYSSTYSNALFNAGTHAATSDPVIQSYRLQAWDFSSFKLPEIYNATTNVVVRRCMIHNDSSVDISEDSEKLVTLIPHEYSYSYSFNNLMFGVYSLRKQDLGTLLCLWGYLSNVISVSFSPLARYVAAGAGFSRYPPFGDSEKLSVVQIIKINDDAGPFDATNVRSFTQVVENDRVQLPSLNCVKWVPQTGVGLAIATNRGSLSICKPVSGEFLRSEEESSERMDGDDERLNLQVNEVI